MLASERIKALVHTDPGTPAGQLLRQYWQPVALAEEMEPGGEPRSVTVMGEDLVLFRDDQGRVGLLGLHCSHRGADLSYGRVEDGGLRCLYHGWLFDIAGRCLEQPAEPKGSGFAGKIQHCAYPCLERAGMIFAYMGPGEPPPFPQYPAFQVPADHLFVVKAKHDCNYLQANEGNIDPSHLSFLHRIRQQNGNQYEIIGEVTSPEIQTEITEFGLRIYTVRSLEHDRHLVRISNFVYPNLSIFPGPQSASGETYGQINWHVPIDDHHHFKYLITYSTQGLIDRDFMQASYIDGQFGPDYRYLRNRENRYLQDRSSMNQYFAGLGRSFPLHDLLATEGQGPIENRSEEHLGYGDKAVIQARELLWDAVSQLSAGGSAPYSFRQRPIHDSPVVRSEIVRGDWRAARADLLQGEEQALVGDPDP